MRSTLALTNWSLKPRPTPEAPGRSLKPSTTRICKPTTHVRWHALASDPENVDFFADSLQAQYFLNPASPELKEQYRRISDQDSAFNTPKFEFYPATPDEVASIISLMKDREGADADNIVNKVLKIHRKNLISFLCSAINAIMRL